MERAALVTSAALMAACLAACTRDRTPSGPSGCDGSAELSVLPVSPSAINWLTPIGNMGPPTHTLPTDHVGFYLVGTGIPLVSPGPMRISTVVKVTYLASPFRQGLTDYALETRLCGGYGAILGHILTATTAIVAMADASGSSCQTYSTADETVRRCENHDVDLELAAGDPIGTVGGPNIPAFDLGIYGDNTRNEFVNPPRIQDKIVHAVCPYDLFAGSLRGQLYARIGDGVTLASGESPQCGAMSVDVAGTAQGVWALPGTPLSPQSDESRFVVLAPHPLTPVSEQTFSMGPGSLNVTTAPGLPHYPAQPSGRVNRAFRDVTADGLVYCYVAGPLPTFSLFIQMESATSLAIRKVTHLAGNSPCDLDPSTWVMSTGAVQFIR